LLCDVVPARRRTTQDALYRVGSVTQIPLGGAARFANGMVLNLPTARMNVSQDAVVGEITALGAVGHGDLVGRQDAVFGVVVHVVNTMNSVAIPIVKTMAIVESVAERATHVVMYQMCLITVLIILNVAHLTNHVATRAVMNFPQIVAKLENLVVAQVLVWTRKPSAVNLVWFVVLG
jgi:hypothetical protein